MVEQGMSDAGIRRALSPLEEGIALAREGRRDEARAMLRGVIRTEPTNEEAWLWLAWVAESNEESLRYLREAQMYSPDSARIAEALAWAQQRLTGPTAPEATPKASASAPAKKAARAASSSPSGRARVKQAAERLDQAAGATQQSVARALDDAQQRMGQLRAPRLDSRRLRAVLIPVVSVLLVSAVSLVIMFGIANARKGAGAVQALELPTPIANATPTLLAEQRVKALWTQVDVAWTRQNWDQSIEALQRIRAIDPYDEEARKRLGEAHYLRGVAFIERNALEDARVELDQAIRLDAQSPHLQKTRQTLGMYLSGLAAYWEQDWEHAAERLTRVYKLDPRFRDTPVMLGEALYRQGIVLQNQERWDEALAVYDRALDLRPDLDDARARRQVAADVITPPKRIEVSISKKTVTLYENHKAIHTFPACTGRREAPTLPGRYQVQTKLPEAYASKWDLRMPHWVGIYWAGGSENGFHALPILSNGTILWRGALGTGCSFGCIVLETKDALTLYNWAELGDVVIVDP
jgi:tetratricopeptide (TPR) repeat protein